MTHDGKKLRPVRAARDTEYPSFRAYRDERRKVLRWLGAGGAAVAASGLLGCDTVMGALGLVQPPAQVRGKIAGPTPHQPPPTGGGDDDSAARPEIRQTAGEVVKPEPPTPETTETGTGAGVGELGETHNPGAHLGGGPRVARPELQPPGEPPMPDPTPSPQARPEGKLRGQMKFPDSVEQ